MGWYDIFSLTYDRSLEALYRPYRLQAVRALELETGDTVLDLACGTGQNFDPILERIGKDGRLIGVDQSKGMLRRARLRARRAGWQNVELVRADARRLTAEVLGTVAGTPIFDAVVCALGLTAMTNWEAAFRHSFALLRPGGRYVIFDVHARERTVQTRLVETIARADLSRRVWEPLARTCPDFERTELEGDPQKFGGTLFLASGTKHGARPGTASPDPPAASPPA